MRRRPHLYFVLGLFGTGMALADGCSAGSDGATGVFTGSGGRASQGDTGTHAGGGVGHGGNGSGGFILHDDGGTPDADAAPDAPQNPCGSQCGGAELCDPAHLGLDDNCDFQVDEGCHCVPGQAHSCFKGDPAYLSSPGCFAGTERCTEIGTWGPCVGGVHADDVDKCYANNTMGCHAITGLPFNDVLLGSGTGTFSQNADTGSESWTVVCPSGVSPCPTPGPTPPDLYTPLQSGEYTVTYNKTVNGTADSCTYPLIVGSRGLRVELSWEHTSAVHSVDLDLHLHKPLDYKPWAIDGAEQDCGYGNCVIGDFMGGSFHAPPHWFSNTAMIPDAVNWYKDPNPNLNSCYFDPQDGSAWKFFGMGCHNPRLDVDDVTCNPGITNPKNSNFCGPENINVDYPPVNQWFRVGVYYYYDNWTPAPGVAPDVHPQVKIYCNGALAADLGHQTDTSGNLTPSGYNTPVTFPGGTGDDSNPNGNIFWEVADVLFQPSADPTCSPSTCVVQPVYGSPTTTDPHLTNKSDVENDFNPDYPPIPGPGTGGGGGASATSTTATGTGGTAGTGGAGGH